MLRKLFASAPAPRFRAALDLPLALALGACVCAACALHLNYQYLFEPALTDDLVDYCLTADALRQGLFSDPHQHVLRAPFPAILSAATSSWAGILPGLGVSSLVAATLLGAVLYLWGLLLHGRAAGVSAALLMMAVGPLVLASRTYGTYPMAAALLAAAGMLVTAALLRPSRLTIAAGSAGVGLALLADHFGLFWAIPLLALLLYALYRARNRRSCAVALLVPLLLSFAVARALPPPWVEGGLAHDGKQPHSLELRLLRHVRTHLLGVLFDHPDAPPPSEADRQRAAGLPGPETVWTEPYVWGHSNPVYIPLTLYRVGSMTATALSTGPKQTAGPDGEEDLSRRDITPWLWPTLLVLAGLGFAWRREPRRLLALAAPLLPFLIFMFLAGDLTPERGELYNKFLGGVGDKAGPLYVKPKFLLIGLIPAPLLLGLAWAALICAPVARWSAGEGRGRHLRVAAAVAPTLLLILLVLGVIPSPIGPGAGWRMRYRSEVELLTRMQQEAESMAASPGSLPNPGKDHTRACTVALAADRRAGRSTSFWQVNEEARYELGIKLRIMEPEPGAPPEPPPPEGPPPPPPPEAGPPSAPTEEDSP